MGYGNAHLTVDRRIGPFEVLRPLGSGGMGEVYEALDTRLQRRVAIKVLNAGLAADPTHLRRLQREARLLAAAEHPNIATVYELDEADGTPFLVMELVEGRSLDGARFEPAEALRICRKVGLALGAAHAKGIVHRDLKPGNVMIRADGEVKVLDFGLAVPRPVDSHVMSSAETEERLTTPGTILGTLYYMSPEQARGDPVDARTDIWAFGALLFELLSGQRPFQLPSVADTLGAILRGEPDWSLLPASTPRAVRSLLRRCLEKAPSARPQSMEEVTKALDPEAPAGGRGSRPLRLAALGLAAAAFAGTLAVLSHRAGPGEAAVLTVHPLISLAGTEWTASWSPDGTQLAFSRTDLGSSDIAVLALGGNEPHMVVQTPYDDQMPRWSPDGSRIAFVSDRGEGLDLYTVSPTGGVEQKVAESGLSYLEDWTSIYSLGANPWSPDGKRILFSRVGPAGGRAVWEIDLAAGTSRQITRPPAGANDLEGTFSFDGARIAFARYNSSRAALWTARPDGSAARAELEDPHANRGPAFMPDGRSLLFYSNRAGPYNVWALPLRGGPPRQLTSGAGPDYLPVVSARGQVLYSNWGHQTDLYLARLESPDEAHRRLTFNTSENYGARFSPDGERLVYYSDRTGNYELWLRDLGDGRERPLTDSAADDFMPDWSPDGREIVFLSNRGGRVQVWTTKVEGRDPPRLVSPQELRTPADYAEGIAFGGPRWSPDGAFIGYIAASDRGQTLWTVPSHGGSPRPTSLRGVQRFDWFRGSRRVVYLRSREDAAPPALFAADLETGRERRLIESPCAEVAVSRDGRQLAYVRADSHFGMNLFRLRLSETHSDDDLPEVSGAPEAVTRGAGLWHVHGGAWSRDGQSLVYTRDTDRGDIYAIQGLETAKR